MSKDPFAFDEEEDRTVLQPATGSQRRAPALPPTVPASGMDQAPVPLLGGINRLEAAASRLLPLVITIKNTSTHPNPEQLRNKLIRELEAFKRDARDVLNNPKKVTQASYVMCTVLDEAAMNTPWGHQCNWAQYTLLSTFHNEVAGGEKFFKLLKSLGKNAHDNIDLLELMYVCLSLGYAGAYRLANNGQDTLVKVRQWLYEVIQSVRARPDMTLAAHWQGSNVKERKLPRLTPLWVACAAALALASLLYISLRFSVSARADSVVAGFHDVKPAALAVNQIALPAKPVIVATPVNTEALTLTQLLQADIDNGNIAIGEDFSEGKIRLLGATLFASGRASLNTEYHGLIQRIADALNRFDGSVLVTGHSDNIPVRAGRFSSNLDLSEARAESVAQHLGTRIHRPDRLLAEGRGDLEPIGDNTTADGRSMNRRVEIAVFF